MKVYRRLEELLLHYKLQIEKLVLIVPGEKLRMFTVHYLIKCAYKDRVFHNFLGLFSVYTCALDLICSLILELANQPNYLLFFCLVFCLLG